jgi:hypothetical protein
MPEEAQLHGRFKIQWKGGLLSDEADGTDFMNADGKTVRISLPNANEALESTEIKGIMDQIITLGVFAPGGFDLTQAVGARIVTTDVVDYDFA